MGILRKVGQALGTVPPDYTPEERRQYRDGFATGYPLQGQPEYLKHNSEAYRRGVRLGIKSFREAGQPQINWESEE